MIREINLPLLVVKIWEIFASYIIFSLIDLYSKYNQVELDKKLQDLISFITFFSFIKTTISL